MSMTLTAPKAKTMALGGVATGSMKAKDVVMAAGNMKNSGFKFSVRDCNSQPASETQKVSKSHTADQQVTHSQSPTVNQPVTNN